MTDNFLTVFEQIIILFILIAVGFFCKKFNLFSETAVKGMTELVLYVVTPCIIVNSFMRSYNPDMLIGLIKTLLCAVFIHIGTAFLARLFIHDKIKSREAVLRFATVFSNCGFMSLPLQAAILGDDGVFYGAIFVGVFNIFVWSYGLVLMGGGEHKISVKKLILNPGLIGTFLGILIFLFSLNIPEVIAAPIKYLSALNTPIPMIIIGFHLAEANILDAIKDKRCYLISLFRLIIVPLLSLIIMYAFNIKGIVALTCIIACSAPTAATTTMFALKFDKDVKLSANIVALTTVLSAFTMPAIIAFSQLLLSV